MTSNEKRREKRYQRRVAERARKRAKYLSCNEMSSISSYRALCAANRKSMRNVIWKESVQRYQMNLLRNIDDAHRKLNSGRDVTRGFVEFVTLERGKLRNIRSVHYSERVVQRSTCDNSLVPMLSRGLIHDNGACREGYGVDHALDRVDAQLHRYYRKNHFSNSGFVLLFDFSGYFDNILHSKCFELYQKVFSNEKILDLLRRFVIPFGYPLSIQGRKEINGGMKLDDSNYWKRTKKDTTVQDKYSGKSLGLGSQISQITAVAYPSRLDHYILQEIKPYGYERYVDDGWVLFGTYEEAESALDKIKIVCDALGINLNEKKTKIINLRSGFTFLKTKYRLTDAGGVVRSVGRSSVIDRRRKLKKYARMLANGEMSLDDIRTSYGSWKGYALRRGGWKVVKEMDKNFYNLFGVLPPDCKIRK